MAGARRIGGLGACALWFGAACAASTPSPKEATQASLSEQEASKRAICPVVTAPEVHERVAEALKDESWSVIPSMLLPLSWPPRVQGIQVLAYRFEALATGVVSHKIHGPTHRITVTPWVGEPQVERFETAVLGREYEGAELASSAEMTRAEQALLDVIARCRSADAAARDLMAYLKWADEHPVRGRDLFARYPEFFAWLKQRAPKPPEASEAEKKP